MTPSAGTGVEWVIEAHGCDPVRLADPAALQALFAELCASLALTPAAPPLWHQFPGPGGVTGLVLLAESHLTVHTFPEHASLCLNLFCCVPRAEWGWREGLARHVGAHAVTLRRLERASGRGGAGVAAPVAVTPALGTPIVRASSPRG